MPKDFVGRLLNLENSLKTAISICDVTNNERNTKMQDTYRQCASTCECSLRSGNRDSESEQHFPEEMRPPPYMNPASASGLLPPAREFDPESKWNNKRSFGAVQRRSPNEIDETEPPEFLQCSTHRCNARNREDTEDDTRYKNENPSGTRCEVCRETNFKDCICRGGSSKRIQNDPGLKRQKEIGNKAFTHRMKPNLQCDSVVSESQRKLEKKEMEGRFSVQRVFPRSGHDLSSEFHDGNVFHKHGRQKICCGTHGTNKGRPATAPANTSPYENRPFSHRNRKCRLTMSKTNTENDSKGNLGRISEEQSSDTCETNSKTSADAEQIPSEEYLSTERDNSIGNRKDFTRNEQKKGLSDPRSREMADIIGKNEENIDKMKRSKTETLNTVKTMKEKYDAMVATKTELSGKIEKLIETNEKLMEELKETEISKGHVIQELENYKKRSMSFILNRMQCINQEKTKAPEEGKITRKEDKGNRSIENIGEINGDIPYEYHLLFRKQEVAYRRLVQGIAVLEKVIKNNKEKEKRLSEMKAELKKRTTKTQAYLDRIMSEKIDLTNLVNKLRALAEEKQSRIDRLQQEIDKKEEELGKQKQLLLEKSESLEETSKEMESIRKNSFELEEQVRTLRQSVESFDKMHQNLIKERETFQETLRRLQCENDKLKEEIANEKDSILIKNKIIQDQQETIKQLREKSDEVKTLVRKVESLERLINVERGENLELQESVERLRRKKDELKQKVKSLEADLLIAPQEVVRDLQKTQIVLHELENQVQLKQKEWEMLLQSLVKEKEQACNFAAFATKKLMETTNDFQKQSDAQKKLYKMLTENIIKKKSHLQAFAEKMKQSVKFSEGTQGSARDIDEEERENSEAHRYLNRLGIPKNNREWFSKNQYLPECYSNIKFNESGDIEPENEYLRHCGI